MTKPTIAYIAGLFDGEGDVGIYPYKATKNGKYYPKLTARIHNTDKKALDWVKKQLGYGNVYRDRVGVKKSGKGATKQGYVFIVTHRQARKFLPTILPYLIIKKRKAREVIVEDYEYVNRKSYIRRRSSVG